MPVQKFYYMHITRSTVIHNDNNPT